MSGVWDIEGHRPQDHRSVPGMWDGSVHRPKSPTVSASQPAAVSSREADPADQTGVAELGSPQDPGTAAHADPVAPPSGQEHGSRRSGAPRFGEEQEAAA